jgi:antitoxin CptB
MIDDDVVRRSRLRWRCRRGMRELDVLLERWLDEHWCAAGAEDRVSFERLLDCEDDRLWAWMTGRETPSDEALAAIVRRITR